MKYVIGNWKAHMSLNEMKTWVENFSQAVQTDPVILTKLQTQAKVIICPPFPLIIPLKELVSNIPNVQVGAQTVSTFSEGAYTGEVTAKTLNGLVKFAIIGHSERRKYFHESDDEIKKKIELCYENNIEPILCIRGQYDFVDPQVQLIAFEPVEAIGTGNNQPVQEVLELKKQLGITLPKKFIYGGSVNSNNGPEYITNTEIDGILPGTASLNPHEFAALIKQIS